MIMKIMMMIMILMMMMTAVFIAIKLNFNGCSAMKSYKTNNSFSHKCTNVNSLILRHVYNTSVLPKCALCVSVKLGNWFICSLSHRDYFLKLKIYYGELNYELIEEEAAYSVRRVGGSNLNGSFHTIIMIIPKHNVKSLEIVR